MSHAQTNKNAIVVGVDFSEAGDHAIREAMRIAKLADSELHVTSVIESDGNLHDKKKLAQLSDALRSRLGELRDRVLHACAPEPGAAAYTQEIVFHVRIGEPAAALIQVAVDVEANLLVVGTHRHHGVEKLLLGSVGEALIRSAPLPVLVAYPNTTENLPKTPQIDPPREGAEHFHSAGLSHRHHLEFLPRTSHISGLL